MPSDPRKDELRRAYERIRELETALSTIEVNTHFFNVDNFGLHPAHLWLFCQIEEAARASLGRTALGGPCDCRERLAAELQRPDLPEPPCPTNPIWLPKVK